jgi:pilus assembly protein Flp/PilA
LYVISFIAEPRSNIHKALLGESSDIIASLFLIKCSENLRASFSSVATRGVVRLSQRQRAALVSNCLLANGASAMKNLLTRFLSDESGVTAIEYGLIAALISVVIITSAATVGTRLAGVFTVISARLAAAP